MKLLVDNNMSHRVAVLLNKSFFSVCSHVSDFNLDEDTSDRAIWKFAIENGYMILTKDADYEALSRMLGCPPKVIQMICGNTSTIEIIKLIEKSALAIKQFHSDNELCLMYIQ